MFSIVIKVPIIIFRSSCQLKFFITPQTCLQSGFLQRFLQGVPSAFPLHCLLLKLPVKEQDHKEIISHQAGSLLLDRRSYETSPGGREIFFPLLLTRAVESESLKVRKSLKIRKKSEKSDLISYQTFWQKCQNAIKCHEMPKCLPLGSGSCIRIFF